MSSAIRIVHRVFDFDFRGSLQLLLKRTGMQVQPQVVHQPSSVGSEEEDDAKCNVSISGLKLICVTLPSTSMAAAISSGIIDNDLTRYLLL